MTTKKNRAVKAKRDGTRDLEQERTSLVLSSSLALTPRAATTAFPDEAFEGFQNPRVAHPMAAGTPSCAVCEGGDLRAGQILVVLDKNRMSHLSCFEGTKVYEAKGESEQTEADVVLADVSMARFTVDTTQNCHHSRWKGRSSKPEARSVIPAGRYIVNVGADDVRLTAMLGSGNASAKHSYLVPKDAPWGCWMDEGVVAREKP